LIEHLLQKAFLERKRPDLLWDPDAVVVEPPKVGGLMVLVVERDSWSEWVAR